MEPRIVLGGTVDIYSKNDNDNRTMIQQEGCSTRLWAS